MIINNLSISNDGYVHCHSAFYSALDVLNETNYSFFVGTNRLIGEIDSGIWATSYLLSMYKYRSNDFVLFEQPRVIVNDKDISLDEFANFTCYIDKLHPLFSNKRSVKKLVTQGLKESKSNLKPDDIKDIFHINSNRFESPLSAVGNEVFKAMSAIAYAYDKQVFCFPWLSKMRFDGYHEHITDLLEILEDLRKIVILPIGQSVN